MTKYIIGLMFCITVYGCATNDAVCDEETAPVTYTASLLNPTHNSHYSYGDTIRFEGSWKKIVCKDSTTISEIEAGQINRMNSDEEPFPRLTFNMSVTDTCAGCTYWIVPDTLPAICYFFILNDFTNTSGDMHRVYLNQ
jgi:hypothetical protein